MQKWKCHKIVEAFKIESTCTHPIEGSVEVKGAGFVFHATSVWANKHNPLVGGYYVRYEDGYESYSPAEAFESGYTAHVTEDEIVGGQADLHSYRNTFGWAIERLRDGQAARRKGWNGKGIFIVLQVPDDHSKMSKPYIYIDTTGLESDNPDAPRCRVPWLASQTDMLAMDWEMVA